MVLGLGWMKFFKRKRSAKKETVAATVRTVERRSRVNVRRSRVDPPVVFHHDPPPPPPPPKSHSVRLQRYREELEAREFDRRMDDQIEDILAYMDRMQASLAAVKRLSRLRSGRQCRLSVIAEAPEGDEEWVDAFVTVTVDEHLDDASKPTSIASRTSCIWTHMVEPQSFGGLCPFVSDAMTYSEGFIFNPAWEMAIAEGMVRFRRCW